MPNNIFRQETVYSLLYFLWAGTLQIAGAYFLWGSMRGGKSIALGLTGGAMTVAAALVMSLHPLGMGRAYIAYAGFLALLTVLWAYHYTGVRPDAIDFAGGMLVLGGVAMIVLIPRR